MEQGNFENALDGVVTRGIFVLCQGKKAFYERSVLLWYSTGQFCRTAKLGTARRAGAEGRGTGCAESIKRLFDADREQKGPCGDTI
jgi:hypothetical protein